MLRCRIFGVKVLGASTDGTWALVLLDWGWTENNNEKIMIITRLVIIYNYPPQGRWIVVDIYRDASIYQIRWIKKCSGSVNSGGYIPRRFASRYISTALHRPWGDSCFSIYQIRWIKKCCFNFFFWNFRETKRHFSLRSRNSEYPRIFRVTGANQNARKLLSTDLVNTNNE